MRALVTATHVAALTSFVRARSPRATLLLFSIAVLLSGGATALRGQSALDGFDPNADGLIVVVVVQPDGKILLGGNLDARAPNGPDRWWGATALPGSTPTARSTSPSTRTRLVQVNAIALQADGKILVGGFFNGTNSIGGQTRNYIARLEATTGSADSFNPSATGVVESIVVQADGKILVAGVFNGANSIGGQTRNYIARLDPATGLADSFDPNANGAVDAIAVQADGKILAGGAFNGANSIGGQTRNFIARLDANTGAADSFDPNANDSVGSIAVQADGKVLAGGGFTSIGGQTRNFIARLDPATGAADSFNPNANFGVFSIVVQVDGQILAGGFFTNIGGQTRNHRPARSQHWPG